MKLQSCRKKKEWKFSRNHVIREVKERQENVKRKRIVEESAEVEKVSVTMKELNENVEVLKNQCLSQQEMIQTLKVKYAQEEKVLLEENNKLKLIYEQRANSRTRRENNPTTFNTITSRTSTLRFDRKKETKQVPEYLHGDSFASLLGAWAYLQTNVDRVMMDKSITGYKKGKFIQHKMNELTKKYETSDESPRKAVVLKYETFCHAESVNFYPEQWTRFTIQIRKLGCLEMRKLTALLYDMQGKYHTIESNCLHKKN